MARIRIKDIIALVIIAIVCIGFAGGTWYVIASEDLLSEERYYNSACKAAQEGTANPGQLQSLYDRHNTEMTFAVLDERNLEGSRHWLRECIELGRVPDSIREVH